MANSREAVLALDQTRITGGPHDIVCALTRSDLPDEMFDPASPYRSAGADARFYTVDDGELPRAFAEGVFTLDSATSAKDGQALFQVRLPALSEGQSYAIKIRYGDRLLPDYAPNDTYGAYAVWADEDVGYSFWESSGSLKDRSGHGNTADKQGIGSVTYGRDHIFLDGDSWFDAAGGASFDLSSGVYSFYATIDLNASQSNWSGLVGKGDPDAIEYSLLQRWNNSSNINVWHGPTTNDHPEWSGGWSALTGQGKKRVCVVHTSTTIAYYVNGSLFGEIAHTSAPSHSSSLPFHIGTPRDGLDIVAVAARYYGLGLRKNTVLSADWIATDYDINRGGAWAPGAPMSLSAGALIEDSLTFGFNAAFQTAGQLQICDDIALGFGGTMGPGATGRVGEALVLPHGLGQGYDQRLLLEDVLILATNLGLIDPQTRLSLQEIVNLGVYAAHAVLTGARDVPDEATLRVRAERLTHFIAPEPRVHNPPYEKRSLKS